jgi:hypothetical protein
VGWMVGLILQTSDRNGRAISPLRPGRPATGAALRLRPILLVALLIPLSFVLVQCGRMAANSSTSGGDSFDERFPKTSNSARLPASETAEQRRQPEGAQARTGSAEHASYRVASLTPSEADQSPSREDQTRLVSLKASAFPYLGNNPGTDKPFLDIHKDGRRGHRSIGGRVYWQEETYNDSRVLMHVPDGFDIRKPGVIVVFFHGNGATLERDVRDRQLVPQQISDSGVNAVLLAPQLAVDAADSSAGKFWQPGGLKRFVAESAQQLARIYGNPKAGKAFASLPIVIVGYSGGFMPAAWSLDVGGLGHQVRGVFLLDAVYGELDKFASWIENNRSGVFVSAYTRSTQRHDEELMQMLREKGIAVSDSLERPLQPGSVVFINTADAANHRDYVTYAWTENPIKDVLVRMAAIPALTRIATSQSSSASR